MKDGIGSPKSRIKWALDNQKKAVSTTNHGNISDWIQIYQGCKKNNLKPILGCEFYFRRDSQELEPLLLRDDDDATEAKKFYRKQNHVTLLTKNLTGYYNMIKIHNEAWMKRFYYKPMVSAQSIEAHHEGIICLSGCSNGEISSLITKKLKFGSEEHRKSIDEKIQERAQFLQGKYTEGLTKARKNKVKRDDFDKDFFTENETFNVTHYVVEYTAAFPLATDEVERTQSMGKFYQEILELAHTKITKKLDAFDTKFVTDHIIFENDAYCSLLREAMTHEETMFLATADVQIDTCVDWWVAQFGKDFYIEIMAIDYEEQKRLNVELIKLAHRRNLPIAITTDSHYITQAEAQIQEMQMLSDQKVSYTDLENDSEDKIWTIKSNDLYYKSVEQVYQSWDSGHKSEVFTEEVFWDAIKTVCSIVDSVEDYAIDVSSKMPKLYDNGLDILKAKIEQGKISKNITIERFGEKVFQEYQDRIERELSVIVPKGYVDYFLIVDDMVNFAKTNFGEWTSGPGRGSAAGSLINYLIGITNVDPMRHQLLFERFLDPSRVDMPDIDCLHELTGIAMADGSIKALKDIKVDDVVLDINNNPSKVLDYQRRPAYVMETIYEFIVDCNFSIGSFICSDYHHMMTAAGDKIHVDNINVGCKLAGFGDSEIIVKAVKLVEPDIYDVWLVDIQVEGTATFQIYPFAVDEGQTAVFNVLKEKVYHD
jgi:DNA polymerase III alpha subunit